MRSLIAIAALASLTLMLSGCGPTVFGRSSIAEDAQTQMLGLSKQDVLSCAGMPNRTMRSEGVEYLLYSHREQHSDDDGGTYTRNCEVTIALDRGRVSKVSYRGRTGGWISKDAACYFVVKDCVVD